MTGLIDRSRLWLVVLAMLAGPIGATLAFSRLGLLPASMFDLSDGFGPLLRNLMDGTGYLVCSPDDLFSLAGGACFHAHRMPLMPEFDVVLMTLFGDRVVAVHLLNAFLWSLPALAAVLRGLRFAEGAGKAKTAWAAAAILCLPLTIPTYLVGTAHMQVEEGYVSALLSLAFALTLFPPSRFPQAEAVLLGLALALLYLTKSSAILVCFFLALVYSLDRKEWRLRIPVIALACLGPALWIGYTAEFTGHASIGTSWDGVNFFKGENAELIDRYPPPDGGGLDRWDPPYFAGHVFADEWEGDRHYKAKALDFLKDHPDVAATLAVRKLGVLLWSVHKYGGSAYGGMLGIVDAVSLYLVRLLELAALAAIVLLLRRRPPGAGRAVLLYLGIGGAMTAPYLAGFAWTRHMAPLILPTAMFLCYAVTALTSPAGRSR